MVLIPWSTLPRATDDNETIEEAIARLIADHEADPEAHLGEGESLSEHKASEVIDHLASSIVTDKYNRSESLTRSPIYTLDNWSTLGTSSFAVWGRVFTSPSTSPRFGYWYTSYFFGDLPYTTSDFSVRVSGSLLGNSSTRWSEWGLFSDTDYFTDYSLGSSGYTFYKLNGSLYAVSDIDGDRTETFIATLSDSAPDYLMSIEYDHFDGIVRWYYNDTEVYSEAISDFFGDQIPLLLGFRAKAGTSGTNTARCSSLMVSTRRF